MEVSRDLVRLAGGIVLHAGKLIKAVSLNKRTAMRAEIKSIERNAAAMIMTLDLDAIQEDSCQETAE